MIALLLLASAIEYKAVTDRVVRPRPEPPQIGGAGSIVKDPVYGTRIARITDQRTDEDGVSCVTAAASFQNTWNSDSTRFVLMCGGALIYRFDPKTLRARLESRVRELQETPAFSFTDPDLLYGIAGRRIVEYDCRRRRTRTLLDLGEFEGSAGLLTVSANERLAVPYAGIQDNWRYLVVFDKRTGEKKVIDTRKLGYGMHLASIDKSGRYVIISKGSGGKAPNLVVWDTETDRFGEVAPEGGGHYAAGYGWLVNCDGGWPSWAQWLLRRLDPDRLRDTRKLIVPAGPKDFGQRVEHSSWNNARPDAWAPVFVSITRRAGAKYPPGPWDDEVVAISTDPARPKVFRFGHHFSRLTGDFWDSPRGNISPDGRFFMFTSNWDAGLGRTPKGRIRQDVFVLECR